MPVWSERRHAATVVAREAARAAAAAMAGDRGERRRQRRRLGGGRLRRAAGRPRRLTVALDAGRGGQAVARVTVRDAGAPPPTDRRRRRVAWSTTYAVRIDDYRSRVIIGQPGAQRDRTRLDDGAGARAVCRRVDARRAVGRLLARAVGAALARGNGRRVGDGWRQRARRVGAAPGRARARSRAAPGRLRRPSSVASTTRDLVDAAPTSLPATTSVEVTLEGERRRGTARACSACTSRFPCRCTRPPRPAASPDRTVVPSEPGSGLDGTRGGGSLTRTASHEGARTP